MQLLDLSTDMLFACMQGKLLVVLLLLAASGWCVAHSTRQRRWRFAIGCCIKG
jgi:hypothetical protein